jgi:hypothetical protein
MGSIAAMDLLIAEKNLMPTSSHLPSAKDSQFDF